MSGFSAEYDSFILSTKEEEQVSEAFCFEQTVEKYSCRRPLEVPYTHNRTYYYFAFKSWWMDRENQKRGLNTSEQENFSGAS